MNWQEELFNRKPKEGACRQCNDGVFSSIENDVQFYESVARFIAGEANAGEIVNPAINFSGDAIMAKPI